MLNITKKTAILTISTALAVGAMQQVQPAQAIELVTNGDFEAGDTGWMLGGSNSFIATFGFSRSGTQAWGTTAVDPARGGLSPKPLWG